MQAFAFETLQGLGGRLGLLVMLHALWIGLGAASVVALAFPTKRAGFPRFQTSRFSRATITCAAMSRRSAIYLDSKGRIRRSLQVSDRL